MNSPHRQRILVIAAAASLLAAVPTAASAQDWVVKAVTGSALVFDDDGWMVLDTGDYLREPFTVRVLSRGSLNVSTVHASVALRSNTTVTVSSSQDSVRVEVLAGAASAYVGRGRRAVLTGGEVEAELAAGSAELHVTRSGADVRSRDGLVTVRDQSGGEVQLGAGESTSSTKPGGSAPPSAEVNEGEQANGAGHSEGNSVSNQGAGASGGEPAGNGNSGGQQNGRP